MKPVDYCSLLQARSVDSSEVKTQSWFICKGMRKQNEICFTVDTASIKGENGFDTSVVIHSTSMNI